MKIFLSTIVLLLLSAPQVFAHEEETEITNLAEADWLGPIIAILVIASAVMIARIIRTRSKKQIINN